VTVLGAATLAAVLVAPAAGPALECSAAPGWTQEGPRREYEADNLFDYMDGNAEGYLVYGFAHMDGVTCRKGDDSIVIDISRMSDFEHAFGMFMATRDAKSPIEPIGMAGQIRPRRAVFAKDRYYVELAANPDKDHSPALRAFVSALEPRIEGRAAQPDALAWFPPEGLEKDSVRLVPESVLGIRVLARGWVGQYEFGQAFVVPEASAAAAAATLEKLKARLGETTRTAIGDEAFVGTDRYLDGMVVFRKGPFVAGFAKLKPGGDAPALATRLLARLP
jgi:hypothetical protein